MKYPIIVSEVIWPDVAWREEVLKVEIDIINGVELLLR